MPVVTCNFFWHCRYTYKQYRYYFKGLLAVAFLYCFWSFFERKKRWLLGLRPRPRWGSLQRSPIPPCWAGRVPPSRTQIPRSAPVACGTNAKQLPPPLTVSPPIDSKLHVCRIIKCEKQVGNMFAFTSFFLKDECMVEEFCPFLIICNGL